MLVFLLLLLLFPSLTLGEVKKEECFECHDTFKKFAHGTTTCTDCHSSIKTIPHDEKLEKPVCKTCHRETVAIYGASIHQRRNITCKDCHGQVHLLTREKKACSSCHSGMKHEILPAREKHVAGINCIACHGRVKKSSVETTIALKGIGEISRDKVDLDRNNLIDKAEWDNLQALLGKKSAKAQVGDHRYLASGNVHGITAKPASCQSCHTERRLFSRAIVRFSGKNPFEIEADRRIFVPELPSTEKFTKTVHGKNGVKCVDCHASAAQISDQICASCHETVFGVYKDTIHSSKGATRCTDCHNPHDVRAYRELNTEERLAICTRCHKDYMVKHKWLSNTVLHFRHLECSTCHSPQSTKSMVFELNMQTDTGNRRLNYDDLVKIYGEKDRLRNLADKNMDGVVVSRELVDLITELERRFGTRFQIGSSIIVTKVHHDYSVKSPREKVCASCHSEHAPFYESMYLIIPEKSQPAYLPVKGTVLSSFPVSVFLNIALLGGEKFKVKDLTRLLRAPSGERWEQIKELGYKWIDIIGILCIAVVFFSIILHGATRSVFRR